MWRIRIAGRRAETTVGEIVVAVNVLLVVVEINQNNLEVVFLFNPAVKIFRFYFLPPLLVRG